MANKRDIKRRISSVRNTQKITKAMKLVSAAKFARASHAVNASRPYSRAFGDMVEKLVAANVGEDLSSPLLRQRPMKRVLAVVVATDRGLCGGLNGNQFRKMRQWLDTQKTAGVQVDLVGCGRKAISWCSKQSESLTAREEKVLDKPQYQKAANLAEGLISYFKENEYDAIFVSFNEFVNALTQEPRVEQFLPVRMSKDESGEKNQVNSGLIVEPDLATMLDTLLARKLSSQIFQVLLEGAASEHGSRMTAMDSATTNADKVSKKLKLQYNRARQAAITKELIEIVSGAEAL